MMNKQHTQSEPKNIFELQSRINKELKSGTIEPLNTGLLGEQMIIASYRQMSISKLEAMRTIINHVIKKKKYANYNINNTKPAMD